MSSLAIAGRHRRLDRPHALRRLRRRPGLEALVPELLDPRQVRLRGEPAHAQDVRHRRPPPNVVVFHTDGDATKSDAIKAAMSARRRRCPASRDELLLLDRQLDVRLEDRHTTFEEIYPPGRRRSTRRAAPTGCAPPRRRASPPGSRSRSPATIRSRRRDARGQRRAERAARGDDRRPRRAGDPALRLRHAARRS